MIIIISYRPSIVLELGLSFKSFNNRAIRDLKTMCSNDSTLWLYDFFSVPNDIVIGPTQKKLAKDKVWNIEIMDGLTSDRIEKKIRTTLDQALKDEYNYIQEVR